MIFKMGIFYGLFSAATFGLIPLFTLPILAAGASVATSLAYRFTLATFIVGVILAIKGESFAIGWKPFFKISFLALLYMLAVIVFFHAFRFLPSGIVATLQFQYPVIVMLIMVCFFHERFRWSLAFAIVLGIAGVALLSLEPGAAPKIDPEAAANPSRVAIGIALSLLAGLFNSLYFVGIKIAKLPRINGLMMTFYVMLFGSVFCLANGLATHSLSWLSGGSELFNAVMLALVTAVISNLTLIFAIRMIGPTLTSILGVMEPMTAVITGVIVFGEPLTLQIGLGIASIMASVLIALMASQAKEGAIKEA